MPDAQQSDRAVRLAPWIVFGAAALVYLNTVGGEFVYDDFPFIVRNPAVHTLASPWKFFFDRVAMSEGGFYTIYRPLSGVVYSLTWALGRGTPAPFHLVNLVAHGVAAVGVWRLACRFGLAPAGGAVWCALVFAVHPVQTEAVAWISGLSNPLFVIGVTGACIAWLRWRDADAPAWPLAAVFGWYLFGLASKEHAVALPLLVVGIEWALPAITPRPWRKRLAAILALFLLTGFYVGWRSHVLGQVGQIERWGGGLWPTLLTMSVGFRTYLRLLVLPLHLHPEYIIPIRMRLTAPGVIPSILMVGATLAVSIGARRRVPRLALGIAWFVLALGPVSNVIPMKTIINERLLYLPLIGFALVLGMVWDAWPRRAVRTLLVLQLACFAVLTVRRNHEWSTSERLWTSAVAAEPRGYTSQFNLGEVYRRQGDTTAALQAYRQAIELRGTFPHAHAATGQVYLRQGEPREAVRAFRRAAREAPADARIRAGLVTALVQWGDAALADAHRAVAEGAYAEAAQLAPQNAAAQAGLARARAGAAS